jgi:mRNA interferase HigB
MRTCLVRILNRQKIDEASKTNSEWAASLRSWFRIASGAEWENFLDVRKTIRTADRVGSCLVFNIAQNRARLIAHVNFNAQTLIVLRVLSHAEYDRGRWKNDCNGD